MLTETLIAATRNPEKTSNNTITGIHFHELQPLPSLKSTFKKNSVNTNCLAISASHVFAAQSDKAVVHVYNREKNNQEALVPFPEKIQCLTLAGGQTGAGFLILGTDGGRLILWELGTGRQVSTPQHHLQATTCVAVDLQCAFVVSASTDASIHVWPLISLLSFSATLQQPGGDSPLSPVRSLAGHRDAVSSIKFGHGTNKTNILVSVSEDNTCIVWDYHSGMSLHTFLLKSSPLCLAIDPVDRAAYIGHEDGSIQFVDFLRASSATHMLSDSAQQSKPTSMPESDHWVMPKNLHSSLLCIDVSFDGTIILSGHQDGKIHMWDAARGKYRQQLVDFAAPVTNLQMLLPTGFKNEEAPPVRLHQVTKPKYETFSDTNGDGAKVPSNYNFFGQFMTDLHLGEIPESEQIFQKALHSPFFPQSLHEEVLASFAGPHQNAAGSVEMEKARLQNVTLGKQLEEAKREIQDRERQHRKRQRDDELKAAKKKRRRVRQAKIDEIARKQTMREDVPDEDIQMAEEGAEGDDLSSDTDELTDSG